MNAEPSPPRPRLRDIHQAEREAVVLADLAEHGPSVFSAIDRRLNHLMGEHLTRRTLFELAKAGKVTIETQTLVSGIRHGDDVRQLRYKARVFALVEPKGKRGKR